MLETIKSRISKGLYIGLTITLIVSIFSIPVFADSSEPELSGSDLSASVNKELIEYDNLYGITDIKAATATDYSQLIYQYLYNNIAPNQVAIYNQLGGSASPNIYNLLLQIRNYSVGASNSGSLSIRDMMLLLCDFMFGDSANFTSGQVASDLNTIAQSNIGIQGQSYANGLKLDSISTSLSNLNNINWLTGIYTFKGYTYDFDTYINPTSTTSVTGSIYSVFEASGSVSANAYTPYIFHAFLPCNNGSIGSIILDPDVQFLYYNTSTGNYNFLNNVKYKAIASRRGIDIYFTGVYVSPLNLVIKINNVANIYTGKNVVLEYLDNTNDRYFDFIKYFDSLDSTDALNKLAEIYASDAEVTAREASQAVIDDTLDNFTGSGSAAAKVSDTTAMKNVSGSIKSGLDTGAGVGNALNVFNTGSGLWDWFTQSNSDNINNPSLSQRNLLLRSKSDYVPDYYSDNVLSLQNILGGDR